MSYSYVKTVFPNYEYSNVYNDKIYSNMNGGSFISSAEKDIKGTVENNAPVTLKQEPFATRPGDQVKIINDNDSLEPYSNTRSHVPVNKDNLHYYNFPIANQHIPKYNNFPIKERSEPAPYTKPTSANKSHSHAIERFGQASNGHMEYIQHISECEGCRKLVMKQFNLHSEQLRNEEIIELISYVMFGVFILVLLDTLKK